LSHQLIDSYVLLGQMQRKSLFLKPLNPISYLVSIKKLLFLSIHDIFVICIVLRRKSDVLFKGIILILGQIGYYTACKMLKINSKEGVTLP